MARDDIYKLTANQKSELRRLTQKANRRIIAFTKEYEKGGLEIIPFEVSGGIQHKSQWHTEKTPISRSIKFDSEKDFIKHINWLKKFDSPIHTKTVTEYTKKEREKTLKAINTSLGRVKRTEYDMINKMSVAELSKFWIKFSSIAQQLGIEYSSKAAMVGGIELYKSDVDSVVEKSV